MAETARTANVVWNGGLGEGSGRVTGSTSGNLQNVGVSWKARSTGEHGGNTSPEELIAAAQASCFSMALSGALEGNETPPQQLDVEATCTFTVDDSGPKISGMVLNVSGQVDGVDQATFEEMAGQAGQNCPVSAALRGNVDVTVNATLK
ncbi:MAG: OsmC family peroxiredoxin [Chloroflexota bacterium]